MNPIRTIRRLACTLTGLAAAWRRPCGRVRRLCPAESAARPAWRGHPIRAPAGAPHGPGPHPRCHHRGPGGVADHPDRGGGRNSGCHRGSASAPGPGQPAVTGPRRPPELMGAKPPTHRKRGRAEANHCRAAPPPKCSPPATRPAERLLQLGQGRHGLARSIRRSGRHSPLPGRLQRARRECAPNWAICASAGSGTGSTNPRKYSAGRVWIVLLARLPPMVTGRGLGSGHWVPA